MGLKQDLEAVRDTVGAVLHNVNTALAERGVPTVGTLAALPDALDALDGASGDNAFWNSYCNASKNDCDYMFAGQSWTAATFTPPAVTLNPKRAMYMFSRTAIVGDTVELFGRYGFSVDFSQCTYIDNLFNNASGITRLGVLDFSGANASANNVFINATALKTIDKLIVGENTKAYTNWFNGASALEDLTIEGVIDKNGFSVQWSPKLSRASLESILFALSSTTTGLTVTFSRAAVNKAFETAEGANDGAGSMDWEIWTWEKPNWTITLA